MPVAFPGRSIVCPFDLRADELVSGYTVVKFRNPLMFHWKG